MQSLQLVLCWPTQIMHNKKRERARDRESYLVLKRKNHLAIGHQDVPMRKVGQGYPIICNRKNNINPNVLSYNNQ